MTNAARPLRTHQRQVFGLMAATATGEATGIRFGLALGPQLTAAVLEVSDELFLLALTEIAG